MWILYPRKKGKAKAEKTVTKLLKNKAITFDELKKCVERYAKECTGKEEEYIKHGSTFFNGGYEDYRDINYLQDKKKSEEDKKPRSIEEFY